MKNAFFIKKLSIPTISLIVIFLTIQMPFVSTSTGTLTITVTNSTSDAVALWNYNANSRSVGENSLYGQSTIIEANTSKTCQVPDDASYSFILIPTKFNIKPNYSPRNPNWIDSSKLQESKQLFFYQDNSSKFFRTQAAAPSN